MDFYGIESEGRVYIQCVSELPVWSSDDEGRILLCLSDNNVYSGTNAKWQCISLGGTSGTSGSSGTSGTSGTSGSSGTSGELPPIPCPSDATCNSECMTCYRVNVSDLSGTCGPNACTDFNGSPYVSNSSDCYWTATYTGIDYNFYCDSGYWYFEILDGTTVCARWRAPTVEESDCPPSEGYSWVEGSCGEGSITVELCS
jgi:hypothetical protein